MTNTEAYSARASAAPNAIWVSVTGALIAFSALLIVALSRNGWVFEYPLDDVYIHLAMAEQIGRGGYGVNAAEYASAASSPLYPFLFAPFEATALQRWLPLVWNIASLSLAAALLGAAFGKSSLGGSVWSWPWSRRWRCR